MPHSAFGGENPISRYFGSSAWPLSAAIGAACATALSIGPAWAEEVSTATTMPAVAQPVAIDFDLGAPAIDPDRLDLADLQEPSPPIPGYGPALPVATSESSARNRLSFGRQLHAIRWELAGALAIMTAGNVMKVSHDGGRDFRFTNEGWFGDDTVNLGMDKLAHAWNTFWITDAIEARIRRKTGATNAALPAAGIAMGLMFYSELWDAHKKTSGFSFQDLTMNAAGAGFSLLRNSVPGLDDKLDFRLQITPNSDIYTPSGTRHYRQMRYIMALKLSGFEGLRRSPLRFVELHAGYRATGFTAAEERRGEPRRQRPFVGIGINLNELFFRDSRGWLGSALREGLQYIQVPYTAYHVGLDH